MAFPHCGTRSTTSRVRHMGQQGAAAPTGIDFIKGHGTLNDFVILPDDNAELDLDESLVRALCDRRAGVGADGVLRIATAGALVRQRVLADLPSDVHE